MKLLVWIVCLGTGCLLSTGCSNSSTTAGGKQGDKVEVDKDKTVVTPVPGKDKPVTPAPDQVGLGGPVVVSGWAIDNPTVTPRKGDYEDKTIEIQSGAGTSPFGIRHNPGNRLAVFECNLKAVTEDPQAVDTFSARRKVVFGAVPDETFRFLNGDGALTPDHRKKLTGKYRLFDMERVVLTDPAGKSYKPVWCIAPEVEFTFIYSRGADADLWEKWLSRNPDLLPVQGRLAVRTNAYRGLNTDGLFLGLMEIDQPATVSVLYEIPVSVKVEDLKVVVEGGKPVAVKLKK
jgi:hypothetical protein